VRRERKPSRLQRTGRIGFSHSKNKLLAKAAWTWPAAEHRASPTRITGSLVTTAVATEEPSCPLGRQVDLEGLRKV
jgi:hypothetical protein